MNAPRSPLTDAGESPVAARVRAVIRADIRALSAYRVENAEGMIKLDANESPFGLSGAARAEIAAAVAERSKPRCGARSTCRTTSVSCSAMALTSSCSC
jgi:histidinol-phosphate aminotransferase